MKIYHPFTIMIFYLVMGCLCICYMHPVLLVACSIGGIANYLLNYGTQSLVTFIKNSIGLWCLIVVMNMLVSHEGNTVFAHIGSSPITLESMIYGACMGIMVISSLLWFLSFSAVMTSDKWMYIFGDRFSVLGLLFSMVLRFIPLISSRYQEICEVHMQNKLNMNKWEQIKLRLHCFGMAVTWVLEKGIMTADSMEARGYGLGKRSHYSQFKFRIQDGMAIFMVFLLVVFIVLWVQWGNMAYEIYPEFVLKWNLETVSTGILAIVVGCYPVWCYILDRRKWRKVDVYNT